MLPLFHQIAFLIFALIAGGIGITPIRAMIAAGALDEVARLRQRGLDPLLPVRLLPGGRDIGGALSWGEPRAVQPFAADGPFAGLTPPADGFAASASVEVRLSGGTVLVEVDTSGTVGYLPQSLTLRHRSTVAELLGIDGALSALRAIESGDTDSLEGASGSGRDGGAGVACGAGPACGPEVGGMPPVAGGGDVRGTGFDGARRAAGSCWTGCCAAAGGGVRGGRRLLLLLQLPE